MKSGWKAVIWAQAGAAHGFPARGKSVKLILAPGFCAFVAGTRRFQAGFLRIACLLAPVLLAGGCSTINVAYNAGPTVLSFMADSYLDLDSEQGAALKTRILAVREWSRGAQVADAARLLGEVRNRLGGEVVPDDIAWAVGEARRRWVPMAERVAGEIADLAPRLTADNLAALRKKFERSNTEFVKEVVEAGVDKQRERRFERTREETERWYGSLEDAQLARIREWTAALPVNYPLALEDRRRRQAEFAAILAAALDRSADAAQLRARLTRLLTQWEAGRSPAYHAFATRYQADSYRMVAAIANMATPAQRETLRRRAQRWIDDMNALAARPGP